MLRKCCGPQHPDKIRHQWSTLRKCCGPQHTNRIRHQWRPLCKCCGPQQLNRIQHQRRPPRKWCGSHPPPIGSGSSGRCYASVAARNTPTGSGISEGHQLTGELHLFLYIEASTNPLPSGYAFNAASPIAKLQHGYVNPLPKETLHHG